MEINQERAVRLALAEAERKVEDGLLIKVGDEDFDWEDPTNWTSGDPETVWSIVTLYQHDDDRSIDCTGWGEAIEAALMEKYPTYF